MAYLLQQAFDNIFYSNFLRIVTFTYVLIKSGIPAGHIYWNIFLLIFLLKVF